MTMQNTWERARDEGRTEEAAHAVLARIEGAFEIGDAKVEGPPLVLSRIG